MKTYNFKLTIIYLLLTTLFISWGGCTPKSDLEKIKVAQFQDFFLYIPLYLADGKGFCTRRNSD